MRVWLTGSWASWVGIGPIRDSYQPVGGAGMAVMPPTFPIGPNDELVKKYAIADRLVDGHRVATVVIDQEPSQANRVEEALLAARDAGRLAYPMFEMLAKTSRGEVRLTSLDFPHRYADAYLRDSTVDGARFDQSPIGQRLREVSTTDVRPLFEREPASLVFGAWDSHRKGRWPKFARLYTAVISAWSRS
jgi:CRISPR-associated protein Csb1